MIGHPLSILLGALLGLVIGSFAATVVIRMPQGRSAIDGRSACDICGRALGVRDLLPLASWLAARGRCRTCGGAIDPLHPQMELAAMAIGAIAFALLPPAFALAGALFGWALLALAALDLRHFWLPDRIVMPLWATGTALAIAGIGPGVKASLIGSAVGFGGLYAVGAAYRLLRGRRGLGGGDPKLFGAIGAWVGWAPLPFILIGAAGLGIALILFDRLRGRSVSATTRVAFGALMAAAAWPAWIVVTR